MRCRHLPIATLISVMAFAGSRPALAQSAPAAYTGAHLYDSSNRVVGTIMPSANGIAAPYMATRNTYNADGRLVKVENGSLATWQPQSASPSGPAGWTGFTIFRTLVIGYNATGQKVIETSYGSDGNAYSLTQFSYDAAGQLECSAVRMNLAAFASPPSSACTQGTAGSQGSDRITRNVYDSEGRLVQIRKAVGTPLEQAYVTYAYSANGKRTAVVDANGNRAEMHYDGFDRQDRWTFPSQTPLSDSQRASFTAATSANALTLTNAVNPSDYEAYGYDANGNRTSLRKRDGSTLSYTYDALNRMTGKVVPERAGLDPMFTRDVYYGYDLLGRQLYARFDSASGDGVTNSYDALGRLTSSTQAMGGTSRTLGYQYDADGNRTRMTFPDNQSFSASYDGLDRMKGIDIGSAAGAGALASVGYDSVGRRSTLALGGGDAMAYAYDGISRLTGLSHGFTGTAANNVALSFGYNPANQITTQTRDNDAYAWTGDYNVTRAYVANGLNQYASAGPASFTYDANGNLTGDGAVTYTYDVENRIVGVGGAMTATLKYDPLGRLYEVTSGSASGTRFLYDTAMGAASGVDALLAEYDSTSGAMLRRYVHGPGLDEPLVWYEGATLNDPRYLHTNHQGSVIAVAGASGQRLAINTYDPYGMPPPTNTETGQGNANTGRFQYTGQIWLSELGLYHYKARAYSPRLGRFLQTDPIGYDDQINLYGYVRNDPINGRDPSGEEDAEIFVSGCRSCHKSLPPPLPPLVIQHGPTISPPTLPSFRFNPGNPARNLRRNVCGLTGFLCSAQDDADAAWDEVTDDAEKEQDGILVKPGGEAEAEADFDKARNGAKVDDKGNGVKVAVLPDGRRLVLRGSSDGRPTLQRQSPNGNTGTKIRYGN